MKHRPMERPEAIIVGMDLVAATLAIMGDPDAPPDIEAMMGDVLSMLDNRDAPFCLSMLAVSMAWLIREYAEAVGETPSLVMGAVAEASRNLG